MRKTRIFIADDERDVCTALRTFLDQQTGIEVAGEAADRDSLLAGLANLHPDLVLLDGQLPGLLPADSAETLHAVSPRTHILVLLSFPGTYRSGRFHGADQYVRKTDSPDRLLKAITDLRASL